MADHPLSTMPPKRYRSVKDKSRVFKKLTRINQQRTDTIPASSGEPSSL
jgi:hypothetical protein